MTIPYDLSERDSEAPADGDEPARDSICDEPTTASPPAAPPSDDLTPIRGIGPGYARKLAAAGVTRFAQIASWSESEVEAIAATLGISPRRIRNADWMGSAAELLND